jgi:hypothetical protein
MIMGIFVLPQAFFGAALIFFFLRFMLEALLVLVFIFPVKIRVSWPLILYIPYLSLCDVLFLLFLGRSLGSASLFLPWYRL